MRNFRLSIRIPLLLAAVAPSLKPALAQAVSVYVPGYRQENWEDLAGSVITGDATATTYTVFCGNTADCQISGPMPFLFTEGPSTFAYSGSVPSRITAVMSCELAGTTAATCTEYSSFGSGFVGGDFTGPTETTRTATYSGTDVEWGVLTMTSPAPSTPTTTATGTELSETVNPTDTAWFFPSATKTSGTSTAGSTMDVRLSTILVSGGLAMLGAALI